MSPVELTTDTFNIPSPQSIDFNYILLAQRCRNSSLLQQATLLSKIWQSSFRYE